MINLRYAALGRDRSLPVPTGGAIPPQAKPARSRHQPPAPTGTAGQSNSSMGPTPPRSTHGRPSRPSAPSPRGAGDRERTDYGCRCRCAPSPARGSTDQPGSTTAWVAVSSQEPPTGRESTRTPGPSAANTPQVLLRSAVCASRFATIDHWRRPLPPRPGWPARPCAPRRHGRRSGHPRPERPARASDPRSSRFPVWGAIRRSRRPVPTHDRIGRPPDGLIPRSGGHRPARPLRHLDTVGAESGLVTARR